MSSELRLPPGYEPPEGGVRIDYPCEWSYTVIGASEHALRSAVAKLLAGRAHELCSGHRSPGGRYSSLELRVSVRDEAERLRVFQALADHSDVRFVL
jgi:putative lipoic acid-binding regulatory protein